MKAIEIIKTLFQGWINLEQGGTFSMCEDTDEQFIRRFFCMKRIVDGRFEVGEYIYFYSPEGLKLAEDFDADIILEDNDGQNILLWRIE